MSRASRPPIRLRVGVTRWEDVPGERVESYWQRLREAGLEPVDLCGAATLAGCGGLVLTGGVDIDPALYGQAPGPKTQAPKRERDDFELALLREALARDLPVLAICRGHQLLNVCLGGGLLQNIESGAHRAHSQGPRASRWHEVRLCPGTRLADVYGAGPLWVNSRHHQAVTTECLAPGLVAAARSADGLIEAVESEAHAWAVGVQWHPEREEPEQPGFARQSARLFAAFAAAVSAV